MRQQFYIYLHKSYVLTAKAEVYCLHKLNGFHQVGLDHITSLYDHLDWEDEDGCYNSSLFKRTREFSSYTEVSSEVEEILHQQLCKKGCPFIVKCVQKGILNDNPNVVCLY